MLDDPLFAHPAKDAWYRVISVDDDGRYVRLDLDCPDVAERASPGQFVQIAPHVHAGNEADTFEVGWHIPLLNRPFSIHRFLPEKRGVSVLLDRVGPGTRAIASARPGDQIRCVGPLGTGMPEIPQGKTRLILVAGGIGVAPFDTFAELAGRSGIASTMAYGVGRLDDLTFRVGDGTRLTDEMERFGCPTYLASISGELGFHGNVVELLDTHLRTKECCFDHTADMESVLLIGCGPWPMLRALSVWAEKQRLDCMVLLEEVMGCGFGVCRSCVLPGWSSKDESDRVPCNITTCRHGPLVDARLIDWDGRIS